LNFSKTINLSHESAITSRTLSSESALERLQNGLDKIEKPTTIELRRSPRKKSHESNKSASPAPTFPCKKCNFVSFTTFADLVEHMMLSHDPPADFPGFRKIERKNYDCPICKVKLYAFISPKIRSGEAKLRLKNYNFKYSLKIA